MKTITNVKINYNTMKIINSLLLILLFVFLSCEKHEEKSPDDISSIKIAGNWEIIRISGGIIGQTYAPNFKYLNINHNGDFSFLNDTDEIARGTIITETDSNNDLWYKFNVDSTESEPTVPLPTYFPKVVSFLDSNNLILSDPCCDLYTYEFTRVK